MSERRPESAARLQGLLLGACVVLGACSARVAAAPDLAKAPPETAAAPAQAGLPTPRAKPEPGQRNASAPGNTPSDSWRPDQDLGPDQFHERVDGAAAAFISLGCRRLLFFRLESPPADLELLVFLTSDGAREALSRDAGDVRSPGLPGDEAWANQQCVFFRSGEIYVRLIADDAAHEAAVRAAAKRVAQAMAQHQLPR